MELFAPNNLSGLTPRFVPLQNAGLREQVQDLLRTNYRQYQLDVRDIFVHDGPSIVSHNFLLVLRDGKVFLKCRPGLNSGPRLEWESRLAARLFEDGLPVVRPLLNDAQVFVSSAGRSHWVLYEYQEGNYFTGAGRELESAGEIFAHLVNALKPVFAQSNQETPAQRLVDLNDFQRLVDEALSTATTNRIIPELCSKHRAVIDASCQEISNQRELIDSLCKPVHLDFHPLNLLVANGEVVCVLDFEDIVVYPLLAALGFGGYKLIRQTMVDPHVREGELQTPRLGDMWLATWNRTSSGPRYSITDLGSGAKYRVLDLIHKILFASLKEGDPRYEYDLEKQIASLYEIGMIFKRIPASKS